VPPWHEQKRSVFRAEHRAPGPLVKDQEAGDGRDSRRCFSSLHKLEARTKGQGFQTFHFSPPPATFICKPQGFFFLHGETSHHHCGSVTHRTKSGLPRSGLGYLSVDRPSLATQGRRFGAGRRSREHGWRTWRPPTRASRWSHCVMPILVAGRVR
jgi:hypothetical protein